MAAVRLVSCITRSARQAKMTAVCPLLLRTAKTITIGRIMNTAHITAFTAISALEKPISLPSIKPRLRLKKLSCTYIARSIPITRPNTASKTLPGSNAMAPAAPTLITIAVTTNSRTKSLRINSNSPAFIRKNSMGECIRNI